MCAVNQDHIMQGSWDIKCKGQRFLSFWAIFCLFTFLTAQKIKIKKNKTNFFFEKMKNAIILNLCNKKHNHEVCLPRYGEQQTIFCHFSPFFPLLPHYWPQKLKFGKNMKNTWIYYPFTHKPRSYHARFLRYKVQRSEFFVILGHFLPFDPPNNPKNNKKKHQEILPFYTCVPQMKIIWCMVPFTPLTTHKIKIVKMKKTFGDIVILHMSTINEVP